MILVTLTINGTANYISDEYCELTHLWDAKIIRIRPVQYATKTLAGGFVEPQYGDIELMPDLFVSDWPPPKSCACTVQITDTTEEAAVTIFTGTAHRAEITRDSVKYELHGPSYSSALTERTWIDDSLVDVFTTYCGASYLNLTLNHDYDRASSPDVYGVFEDDTPVIEMLSTLAEAANHLFYIKGSTLYLVDMLLDNGTDIDADEFDLSPASYSDSPPYKGFQSEGVYKYLVAGAYSYGQLEESSVASSIEHLYARFGNNSGLDEVVLHSRDIFPYESGKYYMMKIKYRRPAGTGLIYAGFCGFADDGTTFVNTTGGSTYGTQHYCVAAAATPTTDWIVKTGYFSGNAATGDSTEKPTVASPGVLQTNAVNFSPTFVVNYNAGSVAGRTDIDFVAVYEVDSGGTIVAEMFYDDFSEGISPRWKRSTIASTGEIDKGTAITASRTAVTTHLGNRKTILEAPRARIEMPLTQANMADPGQRIQWTDESVVPDSDNYINVTGYIRVRDISFDILRNKVIYEGEGGVS